MINSLSLSHELIAFSPSFTVCHANNCGTSCGILCGFKIFETLHYGFSKVEARVIFISFSKVLNTLFAIQEIVGVVI